MKKFGLLTADQIECRQAKANEKSGVELLLYKTARTDANILDEVVGPEKWVNDFREIDGVLFGGIGIYSDDMKEFIWKWDAGSESNIEKEKGEASDAFKRAGSKWGIGRELYSSPRIKFKAEDVSWYGGKCYDSFAVKDIGYDESENICKLVIVDEKTGASFNYENGKSISSGATKKPKNESKPDEKPVDEGKGLLVTEAQRKMLFELAKQLYGERGADEVKRAMGVFGLTSTKNIKIDEYAKLMAELKKGA